MSEDPYRPPRRAKGELRLDGRPLEFAGSPRERNRGPEGLGGWLIVLGFGICLTPLRLCASLYAIWVPLGRDGGWRLLFDAGGDPMLRALLGFELIANPAMIAASVCVAALFLTRSPHFPWAFAGFVAGAILIQAIDLGMARQVSVVDAMPSLRDMTELSRSLIYAAIWIPYVFLSARVRNTFVARTR